MAFLSWVYAIVLAVTALMLGLHALTFTTKNPIFAYTARVASSFISLIVCAFYGTIASACLNIAGYGGLGQWTTARSFKWLMLVTTGVWFKIDDPENWLGKTRPAVFVGNHQTELDVLMLGHMFPKYCSVTSKKSLKYVPFLGWFMALSKTVFIERTSRAQAIEAFAKAADQMHTHKQSVYIFPEGTRSYYDHPDMLSFKKGAFHLAIQAQVPIVPVVVANYSNVLNVKRKIFQAGTVPVKVLAPIETKGKSSEDVDALLEMTRERMLEELKSITIHAQNEGVALPTEKRNGAVSKGKSSGIDARVTGPQAIAS